LHDQVVHSDIDVEAHALTNGGDDGGTNLIVAPRLRSGRP
jgi:hypothetical protein